MHNRVQAAGRNCFLEYHSDTFFGLIRADAKLLKTKIKYFNHPSRAKKRENKNIINNFGGELVWH